MATDWRTRLTDAIEKDGRSRREIARECGFGTNFVSELLAGEKAPSTDRVVKLAEVLEISLAYIFTGVEMSRQDEEFLKIVAGMSDKEKEHLLGLLETRQNK